MSESVGKKFREAREARGLSVADIAHATRITEPQILGLESDDYSGFPSISYARSFLNIYGNFLEVDVVSEMEAMACPGLIEFRGAPLDPKVAMEPQDSVIPIVKGLPEVRPRQVKSVLVPLLFLTMLLLLPTSFLLGRRLGQLEARAVADVGSAGAAGAEAEPSEEKPIERDPIKERRPSDGSLPSAPLRPPTANPDLDALIGSPPPRR